MLFLDQVGTAHHVPDEAQVNEVNEVCFRTQSTFSDIRTLMKRHVHYLIASATNHTSG